VAAYGWISIIASPPDHTLLREGCSGCLLVVHILHILGCLNMVVVGMVTTVRSNVDFSVKFLDSLSLQTGAFL
jgi:hypothetical protein